MNQFNKETQVFMMLVGQKLNRLRTELNYSITEFSYICSIERNGYSHLEKGVRNPDMDLFMKVLRVLDVKPYEFFDTEFYEGYYRKISYLKKNSISSQECKKINRRKLAHFMRTYRKEHKISQQTLAELTNIKRSAINGLENRRLKIYPEMIEKLAIVLEIELSDIKY